LAENVKRRFAFVELKIVLIHSYKKIYVFLLTFVGWFDSSVIRSLRNNNPTTGPEAPVSGYSNGNAVKIRGGRAAVSVCSGVASHSNTGNPRSILPLSVNESFAGWEGVSR
jgi:hypothetical protein